MVLWTFIVLWLQWFCCEQQPSLLHFATLQHFIIRKINTPFCPFQCTDIIPESKEVLKLVDEQLEKSRGEGFPVIVIEGLDATG